MTKPPSQLNNRNKENNVRVNLEKLEHYSVSKEEYSLDTYPTYCGGPCTLLSRTNLERTFEVAKVTNPGKFTMEDVLFTGIMRVKAHLRQPSNVPAVCKHYNSPDKL